MNKTSLLNKWETKTSFDNICTCGGYAWNINGRNPENPHMQWCKQIEEYLEV